MGQINQQLFDSITGAYQMLTNELSKPQEDVVSISVCGATRNAIENVLKLYLEGRGVDAGSAKSIEGLVNLCNGSDRNFKRFDFSPVNCKCESINDLSKSYCLGEDKIVSCYKLFVELKDYVFNQLKLN